MAGRHGLAARAAVALALVAPAGAAADPLGPVARVSFTSPAESNAVTAAGPVAAYARGEGRALVVWAAQADGRVELFGRLAGATGRPLSASRQLTSQGPPRLEHARLGARFVVHNPRRREYVVAWTEDNGSESAVYALRVSSAGDPVGAPVLVGRASGPYPAAPSVAVALDSGRDRYAVAWLALGEAGMAFAYRARARALDGSITPVAPDFPVSPRVLHPYRDVALALAFVARRGFVVAYPAHDRVIARTVDVSRGRTGRPVRVHRVRAPALLSEVTLATAARRDEVLVGFVYGTRLWTRRLRGMVPTGSATPATVSRPVTAMTGARLAFDARAQRYVAAWTEDCDPASPSDYLACPPRRVLMRWLRRSGRPAGRSRAVSPGRPRGHSESPFAVAGGRPGPLLVWQGPAAARTNEVRSGLYDYSYDQRIEIFSRAVAG